MFLFKTSGATLASVVKNEKHAFNGQPRAWHIGEIVLISKNLEDCDKSEPQIQYVKEYSAVMTFKRLGPDHEAQLRAFLKHREPKLLS